MLFKIFLSTKTKLIDGDIKFIKEVLLVRRICGHLCCIQSMCFLFSSFEVVSVLSV